MYYIGLKENIANILRWFVRGSVKIFIYVGTSANIDFLKEAITSKKSGTIHPEIVLFETGHDGVINMIYRYAAAAAATAAANINYLFVRDADSIIDERDIWCIYNFMRQSNAAEGTYTAHVIRDHFHHKSRLTGGLTGITRRGMSAICDVLRARISEFKEGEHAHYGDDEKFLNETIYELLWRAGEIFVHSNFCEYPGETRVPILFQNTLTNFCGNVLQREPYTHFQFQYNDFDVHAQYRWCRDACSRREGITKKAAAGLFIHTIISLNAWREFYAADFSVGAGAGAAAGAAVDVQLLEKLLYGGMMQLPYHARSKTVVYLIECFLDLENLEGAMCAYRLFAYCEVDKVAEIELFARFLGAAAAAAGEVVILTEGAAAASLTRQEPDKIYIIYGNYPDDWRAYPSSRIICRNVWCYETDKTTLFSGINIRWIEMPGWSHVKSIYLMGLESAPVRIYETMQELARMGVNLQKIHIYRAKKDDTKNFAYLGATKNHLDCIEMAAMAAPVAESQHILFLEDDFVFVGGAEEISRRLEAFFTSKYSQEYDVCFLAASKFHERVASTASAADDPKENYPRPPVIISRQNCTTSSGYFLSEKTAGHVLEIVREGYEMLRITGDSTKYCIDRYWSKLQPAGRMMIFKEKLGFQRPSISKITGDLNIMLD